MIHYTPRAGIAVLAAAIVVASAACAPVSTTDPNLAGDSPGADGSGKSSKDKDKRITYVVRGSADRATISYTTPSGMEQQSEDLPWTKTLKVGGGLTVFTVNASIQDGGTVICEIRDGGKDGKLLKRGKSSGAYAFVVCDGEVRW